MVFIFRTKYLNNNKFHLKRRVTNIIGWMEYNPERLFIKYGRDERSLILTLCLLCGFTPDKLISYIYISEMKTVHLRRETN